MSISNFYKIGLGAIFLLLSSSVVGQDKYKEFDKSNKGFTYQGGISLSWNIILDDTRYFQNDRYSDYKTGDGLGVGLHSNFIFRNVGVHTEVDFFLDDRSDELFFEPEFENLKIKKFDVGPIFKLKGVDLSLGLSFTKYIIDIDQHLSNGDLEIRWVDMSKSTGLFFGYGVTLGKFRMNAKYIIYQLDYYDNFEDQLLQGVSVGIGVSL